MTRAKYTAPFLEHAQPIWKVVHRVDAQNRIEGIVGKRQGCIRVNQFEVYAISFACVLRTLRSRSDSTLIRINAGDVAIRFLSEIESRATRPTRDFEHMIVWFEIEPANKAVILINRDPAVLADILSKRFFTDGIQDLLGEIGVGAIKIDAFGHTNPIRCRRLAFRGMVQQSE